MQVYRDQGVSIHDKHIELIVRQMLRLVLVAEQGESPFLPGERVDSRSYAEVNRLLAQDGKRTAEGRSKLMMAVGRQTALQHCRTGPVRVR